MPTTTTTPSRRPLLPDGRPRRTAGFTLVELLVVIGIALVLMGILLPTITKAYGKATRTKMAADLQAIVIALDAYRQDHGDIPRVSPDGAQPTYGAPPKLTAQYAGAQLLCRALLGPGDQATDGANGLGFRTRPAIGTDVQGKVSGPYLSPDKFRTGNYDNFQLSTNPNTSVLLDSEGMPILYYPGVPSANVTATNGYVAANDYSTPARPMFDFNDNSGMFTSLKKLQQIMGDAAADISDPASPTYGQLKTGVAQNGNIDPGGSSSVSGEVAAYKGLYLLLSAGPDRKFGPAVDTYWLSPKNPCDDVANFDRPLY
ncbi:MAG: Type secretion system protein [Phycisphaerales bacterium]|nr:Type secretion system protein [Phycisphaerales bacterium]